MPVDASSASGRASCLAWSALVGASALAALAILQWGRLAPSSGRAPEVERTSAPPQTLAPDPALRPRLKEAETRRRPRVAARATRWSVTRSPERTTRELASTPVNRSVTLSNVGQEVVLNPRVVVNGERDWFDLDALVAAAIVGATSDAEKAAAIWRFLVANRLHDEPAHPGAELHDPVRLLNVYGYGFCDDAASAFAVLCERAGVTARVTGLGGHVVAEAYYENGWHAFDVDLEVSYLADDGVTIPSVQALHVKPELVLRRTSPRVQDIQGLAAMYASANYRITEPREGTHTMGFSLRPGESFVRSWGGWGLYFHRDYPEEPAVYGNGRFRFVPSFRGSAWRAGAEATRLIAVQRAGRWSLVPIRAEPESLVPIRAERGSVRWQFDSPYPLLDARVVVGGQVDGAGAIEVAFAVDGEGLRSARRFTQPGAVSAEVSLRRDLRNGHGRPVYACALRVTLVGGARLDSLTFERDVQLAPASLPALAAGANAIVYRDDSPRRAVIVTFGYDSPQRR